MCENEAFTVVGYPGWVSFLQPFRAVPIKLGAHCRRKHRVRKQRTALNFLGIAAAAGAAAGIGSVALSEEGRSQLAQSIKSVSVKTGVTRAREPQLGDYWNRCADAKAAGTFPIYIGEPGYRDGLDGDSDGIACEPYRGR